MLKKLKNVKKLSVYWGQFNELDKIKDDIKES